MELDLAGCVNLGRTWVVEGAGENNRQCNPEEEMNAPMDRLPDHR
jgi:hypothetical protein